jgi:hypothetical protein
LSETTEVPDVSSCAIARISVPVVYDQQKPPGRSDEISIVPESGKSGEAKALQELGDAM